MHAYFSLLLFRSSLSFPCVLQWWGTDHSWFLCSNILISATSALSWQGKFSFHWRHWLVFLLLKQNKTQKNVLFLNYILQKNKTPRFYFMFFKESRRNKKNSRKQVQLCWCNPSKIILPGWRGVIGARLKFGIKEIWGPDTKSLLRKYLSVFSGHGQHSVKYLRGDHFQEAWLLAGYLIV